MVQKRETSWSAAERGGNPAAAACKWEVAALKHTQTAHKCNANRVCLTLRACVHSLGHFKKHHYEMSPDYFCLSIVIAWWFFLRDEWRTKDLERSIRLEGGRCEEEGREQWSRGGSRMTIMDRRLLSQQGSWSTGQNLSGAIRDLWGERGSAAATAKL